MVKKKKPEGLTAEQENVLARDKQRFKQVSVALAKAYKKVNPEDGELGHLIAKAHATASKLDERMQALRKSYFRLRKSFLEVEAEKEHYRVQYGTAAYYLDFVKTVLEGKTMYKSKDEMISYSIQVIEQSSLAMVQTEEEFQKARKKKGDEDSQEESSDETPREEVKAVEELEF